jgi:hypothetical protein
LGRCQEQLSAAASDATCSRHSGIYMNLDVCCEDTHVLLLLLPL